VHLQGTSSTLQELFTVCKALELMAHLLLGFSLQVRSDSMAAVFDLKKSRAGNDLLWSEVHQQGQQSTS
jgi:hypothetical protein